MIASVTLALLVVTVFPNASCTATMGWAVHTVALVPPFGCWVTASCAAVPAVTVTVAVPVLVESVVSFTEMVWLGAVVSVTPLVKVWVPLSPVTKV